MQPWYFQMSVIEDLKSFWDVPVHIALLVLPAKLLFVSSAVTKNDIQLRSTLEFVDSYAC
jgi:hypothetical protein